MYTQGSNEFNTLIETPNNQSLVKRLVLIDDGTEIENLLSVNLVSSSSQDELQIGTTNMAYIEVSAVTDKILTNREVRLECGVKLSNGTIEYAPIGVYTIQKPKGDIDGISFKANDKMQKFEKPYISSLAYPTTSDKVLAELCNMCGVELATPIDNPISISEKLDGYTCREMLGYIAGIHAKFACFDRLGKLNLRWYSNVPIEKKIGLIYKFSKAENDFTVSKIELAKDAEIKYTSGSGFGAIYYSNPLATQEIADSIFSKLNGFTYNATSLDILDDIRLDLGDVIKVTYLDGMDYLVPCMSVKQNFSQGSTTIEAYSKTEEENEYKYTGPTTKYIERVAHELLIANRIIATKVDAEYVQAHAITTDNLEAITADITNLVVENIKGQYADIHLANIDIADIGQFFADSGLLKDVTIVEGHITGELDAVRINADVIKTGTLSVDRLLITGEDSIVYQINVDSSGLTKAELEDEVYQKYLNGTNIVANSITATQLNVSEIFADKTVTNTLFAQNITATGTITGATLIGANADIEKGNIGDWFIVGGTIEATTNNIIQRSGAYEYDLTDVITNGSYATSGYLTYGKEKITMSADGDNVYLEFASLDELERNKNAFHINYYGVDKLVWNNDFTSYTTTTILGYLDTGIYTPKLSADRTDILSLYARNFELYKGKCAGLHIISANTEDILTVEQTKNGLFATKIGFKNPLGMLGYLGVSSVNGAFIRFKADNSASYIMLDTGNYETYVVPKTGGQFTGAIQAPRFEFGSNYEYGLDDLGQVRASNVYLGNTKSIFCHNSEGNPIRAVMMASYDVLHLGFDASGIMIGNHGLTNDASIYVDNEITLNAPKVRIGEYNTAGQTSTGVALWSSGAVTIAGSVPELAFRYNNSATITSTIYESSQGTLTSTAKFRAPSIEFGSNYEYGLDDLGQVRASNIYIGKGSAYYVFNSSGTAINSIYMDTSNILRFGYGASDIWIGAYGTTTRMRFFASNRIDFCINTPDNEDTSNPALALVSGASGANLTLRPTSVNACATYLGSSSYWFNTVYYATLSQISDRNTKKDIYDISDKYIALWDKLSVKTFRYINDDKTIKVGLIAQDVEKCAIDAGLTIEECGFVLKEYVDNEDYKGYRYSLDYTGLATITMAKVKQIVDIINQHDKRIQELEDEIAILKARINHMQSQYA